MRFMMSRLVLKERIELRESPNEVLVLGKGTAQGAHFSILMLVTIANQNILCDSMTLLVRKVDSLNIASLSFSLGLLNGHVSAGTRLFIADSDSGFTILHRNGWLFNLAVVKREIRLGRFLE